MRVSFIEHNAVARHFLHNNTFDLLGSTHDIKYIFPEKNHRRISQLEPEALNLNGTLNTFLFRHIVKKYGNGSTLLIS